LRKIGWAVALSTHICFGVSFIVSGHADNLPPGFIRLASINSSIRQAIRYATSDNFVGHPIPGYDVGECWLRREAAEALSLVQRDLLKKGLELIVYDCYRPRRAVDYFLRWARDPSDQSRKAEHYPAIDKSRLFIEGYLSTVSAHSKGIAVDVGMARSVQGVQALDLGTPFDFLDPLSHTVSQLISKEAKQNRLTLVAGMAQHGFRNYAREWWHFTLTDMDGAQSFDIPIQP